MYKHVCYNIPSFSYYSSISTKLKMVDKRAKEKKEREEKARPESYGAAFYTHNNHFTCLEK